MTPTILRRLRTATYVSLGLVILAMLVSAGLSLVEHWRLQEAGDRLQRAEAFETLHLQVTQRVISISRGTPDGRIEELSQQIDTLITLSTNPGTPPQLRALQTRVLRVSAGERLELSESLLVLQSVGTAERAGQGQMIHRLHGAALRQLRLELIAPLAVLGIALVIFPITRRRLLAPLDAFAHALAHVASGDRRPLPVEGIDPLLLPLHQGFNELVRRLDELEVAHAAHAASLEDEVRAATRALLEQQRSLARAERLAATGELAASVAHELRNPLAGIQMTLTNLRAELHEPELVQRIDLVLAEVARLTRLLNEILDSARHAPEPAQQILLRPFVDELLQLVRYQIPASIRLRSEVGADAVALAPPDRLRQALLNLLLNSATAIGEAQGEVTVAAERQDPKLRIRVRDDGPGFPAEVLEQAGRPFVTSRGGGTGLGLAMVKRFARDLGGELQLENPPGGGALATLSLPGPHAGEKA